MTGKQEEIFDNWAEVQNFEVDVELYNYDGDYCGINTTELDPEEFFEYLQDKGLEFNNSHELMGLYETWMEECLEPDSDWYERYRQKCGEDEMDAQQRAYEIRQDMAYDRWKEEHGW